MLNVMLDTETLGFDVEAIMPQLAAIAFDDDFNIVHEFDARMDIKILDDEGFTKDKGTLKFWSEQPIAVQKAVLGGKENPGDAMQRFATWLIKVGESDNRGNFRLWTNHLLFDVPRTDYIMAFFGQTPITECTRYNCVEDFASVRGRAIRKNKSLYFAEQKKLVTEAAHDALSDCRWQMKALQLANAIIMSDKDGLLDLSHPL